MSELEIICPQCQNISSSGKFKAKKCSYNADLDTWHCFLCDASGKGDPYLEKEIMTDFKGLNQETVDYYVKALPLSAVAFEYLTKERGLSLSSIHYAQLGYNEEKNAIAIPNYRKGLLKGLKYRHLDQDRDPKYISEPGSENGFFVLNEQANPSKILIVEGEIDALTARQLGFDGMIVAMQTNNIKKSVKFELKKLLHQTKYLYVTPDNDQAGQSLLQSLSELISLDRILHIPVPEIYKDLNEFLTQCGEVEAKRQFLDLLDQTKPAVVKDTSRFFDGLDKTISFLNNRKNVIGDSSGFPLLDRKLGGGFRPKELTLINAVAKTGKTTFISQLMFNLVLNNHRVGFASLEMDPTTQVKPNFLSMALEKNIRRLEKSNEIQQAIIEAIEKYPQLNNIIFFDRYGATSTSDLTDWISYLHLELGVNHIFLDHAGYSLEDEASVGENAKLAKTLKSLTRQFPIHLFVVVQPPQIKPDFKGHMPDLSINTLKGSSAWGQAMDNLITLQRVKDKENELEVRVKESRFPMAEPGDSAIILFYDRETCKLIC